MVFILGSGLDIFGLGLLWVSRCSDASRGCKNPSTGVRGAGAVMPLGFSCAMQGSFAPGEDGSWGSGWEEGVPDGCLGCTGVTWKFLELLEAKQVCASWGCIPLAGCVTVC